jgi:hypothetical protein
MIGYFDGMLKCEARDQLHKIMLNVTPLGSLKPSYIKTMSYIHKIRTACADSFVYNWWISIHL